MSRKLLNFIDIELTERCNQNCLHCYIRLAENNHIAISMEMETAFVLRILKEARDLGCTGVRFTGGEPLLRKDFAEIYDFTFDSGLGVSVATNATLISDEIVDLFLRKKPAALSVSAYGWNQSSFERVTQTSGSFQQFLNGVNLLKKQGLTYLIRYPPIKVLVENSDKLRCLAQQLGASYPVPYAWEITLNAYNYNPASKRIRSLRLDPKKAAQERLKEPGMAERDLKTQKKNSRQSRCSMLFSCPAARNRPTVNAYGQLQVCLQVRHPKTLYDLRSGSLHQGLTEFFPFMRKLRIVDPVYLKRCGRCLLRPMCSQCPAISWMEHGTLTTPADYYCRVTHAEAYFLGLLNKNKKGWKVKSRNNAA